MLLLPMWISAQERSVNEAASVAAAFMNEQPSLAPGRKSVCTANAMTLVHTRAKKNSSKPAYYIFNRENNGGYVIVSGDSRTEDVLVYSEEGQFDPNHINPNFKFWLNYLQEEISMANDSNAVDKSVPRKATTAIAPLLKNQDGEEIGWYQLEPYNQLCPMDKYDNTRCYTGCVATAAAMVLYKWRYPEHGTGTKTHTWKNANKKSQTETMTVDYGATTYDWSHMLPGYDGVQYTSTQATAVATLMYHLGVACEMEYGGESAGGSGAFTDILAQGLYEHFGYNIEKFVTTASKNYYGSSRFSPYEYSVSTTTMQNYFNADLEAGRPIVMGGEDSNGGHEFVCDGRNTNGYFHINWGWEGDGNNYCSLTNLKPSGYNYKFSTHIDAIIGLQPALIDTIHVTGITVSPKTDTLNINEKTTLTATITPDDATVQNITWSSSNPNIATVTATGVVRGIGQGLATIYATTKEGGLCDSAHIVVTDSVASSGIFTLVTDASELTADDEIILVGTYKSVHYAATRNLSSSYSNGYLGVEVVAIVMTSTVTLDEESQVAIFKLSKSGQSWTLDEVENGKLSVKGSKKLAWDEDMDTWSITIVNKEAAIASTNTSYGRILLNGNSGDPRYTNYTSSTSTSMLLPKIFARSTTKKDSVVHVTGVTLGQTNASLNIGETVLLYHDIYPVTATNQNYSWSNTDTTVAKIDQEGYITALAEGTTTITITTADGGYTASCVVTVTTTPIIPTDTIYVSASQAKVIGEQLAFGASTTDFYGVTGYITIPNSTEYLGFWMDDQPGTAEVFQGFNCQMPDGYLYLEEGMYVCVLGYIMNYNDRKSQIKDGKVLLLDTPSGIQDMELKDDGAVCAKRLINGQLYIIHKGLIYNTLGELIR